MIFLFVGVGIVVVDHATIVFAAPAWAHTAAYAGASCAAVAGIVLGLALNRPAHPLAWRLLLAGQVCFAGADLTWTHYEFAPAGWHEPLAHAFYLGEYPLLALALAVLVRRRTPGWHVPTLIDTCVLAIGTALVWWVFVVAPQATSGDIVILAYPLLDILIFGMALRLMLGAGARSGSYRLLQGGFGMLLLGDVVSGVATTLRLDTLAQWNDAPFMLASLMIAASALHPSMRRLDERASGAPPAVTTGRLALLAAATLLAPAVLLIQYARGAHEQTLAIGGACAALFLLVVARLAGFIIEQHRAAITDALTGLRTRRHADERLRVEVDRVRRTGGSVSMITIDADRFKSVNDTYGHLAGDVVLVELAERIRAACRMTDVVARLGGEEFVALLPGTTMAQARRIAERIRVSVEASPIEIGDGMALPVTVSVGVAGLPDHADTADALLRVSDQALYTAKRGGRNRVVAAGNGPSDEERPALTPR